MICRCIPKRYSAPPLTLKNIFAMKLFENLTFSLHGWWTVFQWSFEDQKRKNRSNNKLARGRRKYDFFFSKRLWTLSYFVVFFLVFFFFWKNILYKNFILYLTFTLIWHNLFFIFSVTLKADFAEFYLKGPFLSVFLFLIYKRQICWSYSSKKKSTYKSVNHF